MFWRRPARRRRRRVVTAMHLRFAVLAAAASARPLADAAPGGALEAAAVDPSALQGAYSTAAVDPSALQGAYSTALYGAPDAIDAETLRVVWPRLLPEAARRLIRVRCGGVRTRDAPPEYVYERHFLQRHALWARGRRRSSRVVSLSAL